MIDSKGTLIVSTFKKTATGKKFFVTAYCVVVILIFLIIPSDTLQALADKLFDNYKLGWLIRLVCILLSILANVPTVINIFTSDKSYCEVYEHTVIGTTVFDMKAPDKSLQAFELKYSEILNVTITGNVICIYTAYATYNVLALENCEIALKEIRARMCGRK